MSRRGGNRLAVLLMTGVLVGGLWDWGVRWLGNVLDPWRPVAEAACDDGLMIDPDGKCLASRSLLAEPQGVMIELNGQPRLDDGPMIDPNGQADADHGLMIDPNG